ncbi:hypothetical protein XHV734_2084 [Xanthomonas hortorum pv. vitians]|nr:hypothetical protein XHV734_2084 [Xanthomonas hortorum pv. vitians]
MTQPCGIALQPFLQLPGVRKALVLVVERFAQQLRVGMLRRQLDQATKRQRHVHLGRMHQFTQHIDQVQILVAAVGQTQLGRGVAAVAGQVGIAEVVQPLLQRRRIGKQWRQRLRQASQVPVRHLRLGAEAVTPALRIGGIRRPVRVVVVDPAIWAVIDGQAQDRHVVGVHHPMHETDPHPVRHHHGGALADLRKPGRVQILASTFQLREIACNGEIRPLPQQRAIPARTGQFEVAEADERWRHPAYDGARLALRPAVVKHVAHHCIAGRDQAQCARGRHTQMVHRFAAQEFSNRRAQHGAPIGTTRIRRRASALELQFVANTIDPDRLAQRDRTAIAELAGPMPELVPAIIDRPRLHARIQRVATKHLGKTGTGKLGLVQPELLRQLGGIGQQPWRCDRRRRHRRPGSDHIPATRPFFRITRQLLTQSVVELDICHGNKPRPERVNFAWVNSASYSLPASYPIRDTLNSQDPAALALAHHGLRFIPLSYYSDPTHALAHFPLVSPYPSAAGLVKPERLQQRVLRRHQRRVQPQRRHRTP